ncbi:MAG: hypothetical protein ACLS9K_15890 [Lachnospira eligens]
MYIIRYDVIKGGSTTTAGLYGVDQAVSAYTVTVQKAVIRQRILKVDCA